VVNSKYLFTQGKHGKLYFISKGGELQSLSTEDVFSEDEQLHTVFNFIDHFGGDFD
jgi:hypothetical protein